MQFKIKLLQSFLQIYRTYSKKTTFDTLLILEESIERNSNPSHSSYFNSSKTSKKYYFSHSLHFQLQKKLKTKIKSHLRIYLRQYTRVHQHERHRIVGKRVEFRKTFVDLEVMAFHKSRAGEERESQFLIAFPQVHRATFHVWQIGGRWSAYVTLTGRKLRNPA